MSVNKGGVESEANVTEIHEALHLDEMADGVAQRSGHFGIFSVAWGSSGKEIAAGTGESSVLLYDIEAAKVTPIPVPMPMPQPLGHLFER